MPLHRDSFAVELLKRMPDMKWHLEYSSYLKSDTGDGTQLLPVILDGVTVEQLLSYSNAQEFANFLEEALQRFEAVGYASLSVKLEEIGEFALRILTYAHAMFDRVNTTTPVVLQRDKPTLQCSYQTQQYGY